MNYYKHTPNNLYCVLIKVMPAAGGYRFQVLMVNRKSDQVQIPDGGGSFRAGQAADALGLAHTLQDGTERPLHVSLSGYAGELKRIDREVFEGLADMKLTQRHKVVDVGLARDLYYATATGSWGLENEMAQDLYDNSTVHYGDVW